MPEIYAPHYGEARLKTRCANMTLIIVDVIPYFAFAGAGLILAWLGFDILRSRKPKAKAAPAESVRGLAGPAEPLREVTPEPEVPVSFAVDLDPVAIEVETSDNIDGPEHLPEPASRLGEDTEVNVEPVTEEDDEVRAAADESARVLGGDTMIRRDPSVRVFDAVVAASERKVLAPED